MLTSDMLASAVELALDNADSSFAQSCESIRTLDLIAVREPGMSPFWSEMVDCRKETMASMTVA